MVNFRYHVVSIVAVFLALGMGILAGSTVISEGTVAQLERNQRQLDETNEDLRRDFNGLERRAAGQDEFAAGILARLVRGTLTNRRIVLAGFDSTPAETLEALSGTLLGAGAQVEAVVVLNSDLDLSSEERREAIATALQTSTRNPVTLQRALAEGLAQALAGGRAELLTRMTEQGLAEVRTAQGAQSPPLQAQADGGASVVMVGPAGETEEETARVLILPMAASLSEAQVVSAVCETGSEELGVLTTLREDAGSQVVTVDGVDTPMGQAAVALGLQSAFAGRFGHYGLGEGASAVVPEVETPQTPG
ncbi:MAG: copper transporter [Actinomycetota bacterium]